MKFWKKFLSDFSRFFLTLGQVQLFSYFFFGPWLTLTHTGLFTLTPSLFRFSLERSEILVLVSYRESVSALQATVKQTAAQNRLVRRNGEFLPFYYYFGEKKILMKICDFFIKIRLQDLIQIRTQIWKNESFCQTCHFNP